VIDEQRFGASSRDINTKKQFHFSLLSHKEAQKAQKNIFGFVPLAAMLSIDHVDSPGDPFRTRSPPICRIPR
jgi:hypothetical protein